jgi:hypothetical protein
LRAGIHFSPNHRQRCQAVVEMDGRMVMIRKSSMFAQASVALSVIATGFLGVSSATVAHAQAAPRITGPVESSALVSLPGDVHPWARPQFDRGVAPANLRGHMLVVLKRTPDQETELRSLIASQQDPHSPNYHKWLTPDEFGKRFGVADSDVQSVTSYLSGQGMRVGRVYGNHMAIEVEATTDQIRSAFQTEVHAYAVAGKTYYANSTSPKIPAALSKVVSGFASLNSFHAEGGSGAGTRATFDAATHTLHPLYTISGTPNTYGVSPADLRVIYNIPATTAQGLGGKNVNVGIVGDSDINVQYINNYRTTFGLGTNPPIVVVDGNDPGVNSDAYIAYKQIELVSAVAPNATIYYYTSATTDYDSGIYFALTRAVNDNQVQVLLNGMQECETAIGSSAMNLVNGLVEQAAAQGITFVAAAGNSGSAGCAVPGTSGSLANAAYAVNGFASSPFLTSVGGTDFYYGSTVNYSSYWGTNTGYASALKYIPEQVWNDSYSSSNAVAGTSVQLAGGGGPSTAGLDGVSTPSPIPSYQSSNTNANSIGGGIARVIPDVSFFAGSGANDTTGYNNTAYMFCMQPGDCLSSGTPQFTYSGGTEASSAVFAGAVALAVANYNSASRYGLGNINQSLYSQFGNTIISHDITLGSNELACSSGTSCSNSTHMKGYTAGSGYDAATGLGSFDISSFVINYKAPNTTASSVTLTVTDANGNALPTCTVNGVTSHCIVHSTWLKFTVSASGSSGTPTGDVAIFSSSPLQAQSAVEALTLSGGTATDNWNLLPGGTYNLYARYAGDTTYAPSVSATPYSITVTPENCQLKVYSSNITTTSTTSIPYGSSVTITAEPYPAISTQYVSIPSGSIQVFDNGKQITTLPVNSEGAVTFQSNLLAFGSHSIVLTFGGDASFNKCVAPASGGYLANITKAATTTVLNSPELDTGDSGSAETLGVTAVVTSATTPSNGIAPTGTVTFSTKTPRTVALTPGFDPNGNAIATASTTIGQNDIPSGGGGITATYNPATTEVNYTGSTSSAVNFYPTIAKTNYSSTTTFYITDVNGTTYPSSGTYPNTDNPSFPALDSLTLHMHVKTTNPNSTVFLVYANGVLLTPATWSGGFLQSGGIQPDTSGNATFAIPQQNGYLALPSGPVQFTVVYDGWYSAGGLFGGSTQSNPSSANQIVTIVDDRTSADFSLQSDTTVNQSAPLVSSGATQATYNLRLTSIYNFVSAYSTTPINLSCSITGYSLAGVRSSVPAGLACGFNPGPPPSGTTTSVQFSTSNTGFITLPLYVGAASGYGIASNTAPAQPASHWWIAGGGTTLACIFLLGLPARRRKWQSLLGLCILMIVGFGMTGCGVTAAAGPDQQGYNSLNGGSSGSQTTPPTTVPAGTYTVVVTATSTTNTTLVHSLPVQVLVGTTN